MDRSFRSGLILLLGVALLAAALSIQAILLESTIWTILLAIGGVAFTAWGAFRLREELGRLFQRRRTEIALRTIGMVAIVVALAYLSARYPSRFDLTSEGLHSLSEQTTTMLERLQKPVEITFFHDPMMRDTIELYELIAAQTDNVTVTFHDPTINPAQARLLGVQFPGTAVMKSEDRTIQIHGYTETDIANGILRVSQGAKQLVCFLDGHGEADPFSKESHDHLEGTGGHSHGIGAKYVMHERHGLAKARQALETVNYQAERLSLVQGGDRLADCAVLIVAGPKIALLDSEVAAIRAFLLAGGNAVFMLDPFLQTGLEPVIREYGVIVDDTIVIDEASHYWADISAPAVTTYNKHQVTRELPLTFFPGARSLSPTPLRPAGTAVVPLANSSGNSYAETTADKASYDEGEDIRGPVTIMLVASRRPVTPEEAETVAAMPPVRDVPDGDASMATPVPNEATGRSRIAVIGDSDFATNSFFHFLGNGNLFLNTVNYVAAQEDLIGLEPKTFDLPQLSITNRQMKGTFFLAVILLPSILGLIGLAVWWRQK